MVRVFLAAVLAVLSASPALSGVPVPVLVSTPCDSNQVGLPDPSRSTAEISGQTQSCQFRFRADGGLDVLAVHVTLRDSFDQPIDACETSVTLHPNAGSLFCSCNTAAQVGVTAPDGTLHFEFAALGGHGNLSADVTSHCCGDISVASLPVAYTSPDLDGSCESAPVSATNVLDLGLWASGFPPSSYQQRSDYDCSLTVDILDLGVWASGMTVGCQP